MVKEAQGGLSLLVVTEQELDADLATARTEGARLIDAARADAAALVRRLDDDVAASVSALRAEIESERVRRLAEIASDARRDAERYDQVEEVRIARLASFVVDDLIAGGAGAP